MTKRAGKYRHIRPLPGPPIQNHDEWVCIGCGRIEWLAHGHRSVRHCATGCWTMVANLTEIGLARDVVEATMLIGGAAGLYTLIKHARAEHGLETDPAVIPGTEGFSIIT